VITSDRLEAFRRLMLTRNAEPVGLFAARSLALEGIERSGRDEFGAYLIALTFRPAGTLERPSVYEVRSWGDLFTGMEEEGAG
jgi:hypothetical protein